jgi:hypothetical protein
LRRARPSGWRRPAPCSIGSSLPRRNGRGKSTLHQTSSRPSPRCAGPAPRRGRGGERTEASPLALLHRLAQARPGGRRCPPLCGGLGGGSGAAWPPSWAKPMPPVSAELAGGEKVLCGRSKHVLDMYRYCGQNIRGARRKERCCSGPRPVGKIRRPDGLWSCAGLRWRWTASISWCSGR